MTRVAGTGCLAIFFLACTQTDRSREGEPSSSYVYVSNEDSNDISVIDTRTDSVVATIPVGKRPRGIVVSPDGRTVYVALSGSPKAQRFRSGDRRGVSRQR